MADRQRRRFVNRGPSRTDWSRFVSIATTVAPATKILLGTLALSNPGISETARRTRGVVSVSFDQTVANENQVGAFGMIIVNDLAVSVGASAIPGPFTDNDDDGWFVYQQINQRGSANINAGVTSHLYEFDSKAMRKASEGFAVALMIENGDLTHAMVVGVSLSLLSSRS